MMASNILRQISLNKRPNDASNKKEIFEKPVRRHVSSSSSKSFSPDVVQIDNETLESGIKVVNSDTTALFIGNLDSRVTSDKLTEIFRKYPSFVSAKVCCDSESQISLGHGYLNFGNKTDAEIATDDFNYQTLFGKEIRIMPSIRDSVFRKNIGTNVFFSNLPLQTENLTSRRFYDIFRQFGKVLSIRLDSNKNIGFVYFEDEDVAKNVIKQFNKKEFLGNIISCGIHFDKDVRKDPQFEKKLSYLDNEVLVEKELEIPMSENIELKGAKKKTATVQPNGVFVKNLPLTTEKKDLLDIFSQSGPIKSVFLSQQKDCDYLWAFITYKDKESVSKSIFTFNGKDMDGKKLFVTHAYSKQNVVSKGPILHLDNLSPICNKKFLNQVMAQLKIKGADIIVEENENSELSTMKGQITFQNKSDLLKCKTFLDQKTVGGCVIQALFDDQNSSENTGLQQQKITENKVYRRHGFQIQPTASNSLTKILGQASVPHMNKNKNYYIPRTRYAVAPSIPRSSYPMRSEHENNSTTMEVLNGIVKKKLDNLKFPFASRPENLNSISEYIFTVYWNCDKLKLSEFLLLVGGATKYDKILAAQIDAAATTLGFGR